MKRRIKKWQDAFESDAVTLEEFRGHLKELQQKRQCLESQLADLRPASPTLSSQSLTEEEIIEQLKDFRRLWALADDNDKRRLVLSFIQRVTVTRDGNINIQWL